MLAFNMSGLGYPVAIPVCTALNRYLSCGPYIYAIYQIEKQRGAGAASLEAVKVKLYIL